MQHLVGSTIAGRFRLLRPLGAGGFGAVFEALEIKLERQCAVKLLTAKATTNAKRRFVNEAKFTAKINHPGVVKIFDQGTDEKTGFPYIAMEYLPGESLEKTLERGPLPWKRVRKIVLQICRALEASHRCKVVHRDLKPSNCVRMTIDGNADFIKVVDFGIAKALAENGQTKLTAANSQMGTLDYMSFEQVNGEEVDYRTDVWSAGVLVYELISGCLPFRGGGNTQFARFQAILESAPIPLTGTVPVGTLPDGLSQVINKALEKDRNQRFQSMESFRQALEALPEEAPKKRKFAETVRALPAPPGIPSDGQTELDPANVIPYDPPEQSPAPPPVWEAGELTKGADSRRKDPASASVPASAPAPSSAAPSPANPQGIKASATATPATPPATGKPAEVQVSLKTPLLVGIITVITVTLVMILYQECTASTLPSVTILDSSSTSGSAADSSSTSDPTSESTWTWASASTSETSDSASKTSDSTSETSDSASETASETSETSETSDSTPESTDPLPPKPMWTRQRICRRVAKKLAPCGTPPPHKRHILSNRVRIEVSSLLNDHDVVKCMKKTATKLTFPGSKIKGYCP